MHYIDAQLAVCMFLDSKDRSLIKFQNIGGLQLITKFLRIQRTNTCKKNLVCSFVLLWISQQVKRAYCSEYQNCEQMDSTEKWIPQM